MATTDSEKGIQLFEEGAEVLLVSVTTDNIEPTSIDLTLVSIFLLYNYNHQSETHFWN